MSQEEPHKHVSDANEYLFIFGPFASNTHKPRVGRGQRLVFAGLSCPPVLPPNIFSL